MVSTFLKVVGAIYIAAMLDATVRHVAHMYWSRRR